MSLKSCQLKANFTLASLKINIVVSDYPEREAEVGL